MKLLSIRDACDATGLHRDTIRRAINKETLRAYRPPGTRAIRIEEADLRAWVEAGKFSPSPARKSPAPRRRGRFAQIVDLDARRA